MSEEKKDLDYYLQHPDEFPSDPEEARKVLDGMDMGGEIPAMQAETKEAPKAEEKPEAPEDKKGDEEAGDKKPDGVLTKDGKHVIPYAEMERRLNEAHSSKEAEAAARKAAENYVKELEAKLADAHQGKAALSKDSTKPSDAKGDEVTDVPADVMEVLKSEFPTHARAIEALQIGLKGALEQNQKLREEIAARIEVHDRDRKESIQDETETLIAQNADLAAWRSKPLLWNAAIAVDDAILSDKKFLDEHLAKTGVDLTKDDSKRYEMVVSRVKQEVGLPATASPKSEQKEDLSRKAEDKVRAAQEQPPIRSLSDIRGGQPPAGTLEDNLDNVPAAELAERLMNMNGEQLQKWLSRVA